MNNIIQQNNLPNEIIHKEYTLNESLSIIHKESQLVTPLKKASPSDDNNIIQQNNFTNTCIINLDEKRRIKNQESI